MPAGLSLTVGSAAHAGPSDLPGSAEGPAAARRRAAEILARPEFQRKPRSVLQRLLDWVGELVDKIIGGVGGGSPLLAWGAVAVLAGLVGFVLWRAVRAFQSDVGIQGDVAVDGRLRPPADWRAEAAAHEAAGRWRDAVRCTWRALVADLAARGLAEEVAGRTTGEYRAGIARSLPSGAEPFSRATRLFEDAWYAAVEVGPGEAAQVKVEGEQVLAQAGRRS